MSFVVEFQQTKYSSVNSSLPGLTELMSTLEAVQGTTTVAPIRKLSQLELTADGKTADGLRFTRHAMSAVTSALASGLTRLVFDVAESAEPEIKMVYGQQGEVSESRDRSDTRAIALYNAMLRFRFNRLGGLKLLLNSKAGQIDGVLGQKYKFYSNCRFAKFILAELKKIDASVTFHEAVLRGRNLVFRCQLPSQKRLVTVGESVYQYFPGLYAVNSEVGDYSVGVLPMLISAANNGRFVQPAAVDRGKKFKHLFDPAAMERLLAATVTEAVAAIPGKHTMWQKMSTSNRRLLGLGGSMADNLNAVKRLSGWLRKQRGVTSGVADKVMEWVQTHSANERDTDVFTPGHTQRLGRRSRYDLAVACSQVGRRMPSLRVTETLEKLGYDLMFGSDKKVVSKKEEIEHGDDAREQ